MTAPLGVASVVDTLRDLITVAVPGVPVFDGPGGPNSRAFATRSVTVAEAFEDNQDAVSVERSYTGAGLRTTETMSIACSVYAGSGDADVDAHRAAAADILRAIETALAADRTLGGTVAQARIDAARWVQGADENGAGVYIGFTVVAVRLP